MSPRSGFDISSSQPVVISVRDQIRFKAELDRAGYGSEEDISSRLDRAFHPDFDVRPGADGVWRQDTRHEIVDLAPWAVADYPDNGDVYLDEADDDPPAGPNEIDLDSTPEPWFVWSELANILGDREEELALLDRLAIEMAKELGLEPDAMAVIDRVFDYAADHDLPALEWLEGELADQKHSQVWSARLWHDSYSYDEGHEKTADHPGSYGGEHIGSHRAATIQGLHTDPDPEWNNWKRSTKARRQWLRHKRHQTRAPRRRLNDLPTFVDLHDGTMSLHRDHDDMLFCEDEEYFDLADGMSDAEIERAAFVAAIDMRIERWLLKLELEATINRADHDLIEYHDYSYELYDDWDDDDYDDAVGIYESGPLGDEWDDDSEDERRGWSGPAYDWDAIEEATWDFYDHVAAMEEEELDKFEAHQGPLQESHRQAVLAKAWSPRLFDATPSESWKESKLRRQWQKKSDNPTIPLRAILAAA